MQYISLQYNVFEQWLKFLSFKAILNDKKVTIAVYTTEYMFLDK